jgi:hypothetical protein
MSDVENHESEYAQLIEIGKKLMHLKDKKPLVRHGIEISVVWASGLSRTYGIILAFWIGKRIMGL